MLHSVRSARRRKGLRPLVTLDVATDLSERQGCLGLLKRLFGHGENPATDKELPYHVRDDFLSPAERSFYGVLTEGVAGLYVVCPKVNVADLLNVTRLRENRGYFNKIQQKHIDFVLCEPGPMRPVAVVELDDSSHQRRDRQERDEFLDQVFQAAGLPIIHFAVRSGYSVAAVSEEVRRALVSISAETPAIARLCLLPQMKMLGARWPAISAHAAVERSSSASPVDIRARNPSLAARTTLDADTT